MTVRFDDSLPALARVVVKELGEAALSRGIALRDTTGRLAFFAGTALDESIVERLTAQLRAALGPYARTDRVVAGASDFGASEVLADTSAQTVFVDDRIVRLLDRRLVGADWLRAPSAAAPPPPRFVFASLKGGVGRSTALSVTAAHLASHGRRVLAVDFDMEAPGLGAMLLDEATTLPDFGLIDALVENGLAPLDDLFLADLVGPSGLADRGGKIDVIPAFGRRSLLNPGDVLAKIARAYVEDVHEDGTVATVLDQVSELVGRFADVKRYDAILVDARAGLHETTAAAILGLGAEVLLFGLDEPQTFQGYSALFAHLARFVPQTGPLPEWLDRLTLVQGKAISADSHAAFVERCQSVVAHLKFGARAPSADGAVMLPARPFHDVPWDDDVSDEDLVVEEGPIPREPVPIFEDDRFRLFQPMKRHDLLSEPVYRFSYGEFLARIDQAFPGRDGEPN